MKKGDKKLHFLDRYLGVPLIFSLGVLKRKRKNVPALSKIKKIGILNPASIGDTVLLFGIIKDIRNAIPQAEIIFFSGSSNHAIALMCNDVDKVIMLKLSNPVEDIKTIKDEGRFDILIDCMPWPRINALLAFFTKANIKIGFKTTGQHKHYIFDKAVGHSSTLHEIDNLRNLIRVLGVTHFSVPCFQLDKKEKPHTAILHMYPSGAQFQRKMWPEDNWFQVIKYLQGKKFRVYLTGGKADRKQATAFVQKYNLHSVKNVAGELNLRETMALINGSGLTISVNTGIMHLAAALQTNLITLNGPTSVKRWGAITDNPSYDIQSPHPDAPCLNLGFEYSCKNENCNCMAMILVEDVIKAIESFDLTNIAQSSLETANN